jgi:peroxiredoxin
MTALRSWGLVLLLSTGAAQAARPKAAPPKPPTAAAALARLKRDEAAVKTGRLSLHSLHRRADLPPETKGPAGARAAVVKAGLFSQQREYLVFTGEDWKRDITTQDPRGDTGAHYVLGVTGKVGRVLQETGHADTAQRQASIGAPPEQNATDRILFYRGADLLDGITWRSVKAGPGTLTLAGARQDEQFTVTLRTSPAYAIQKFAVSQSVETPEGAATRGQEITAAYEPGKRDLKSLEFFMYVTGAVNRAALTTTRVEGSQLNLPIPAPELVVTFPPGTPVTDSRVDPPVRYAQGEKDLSLAELRALERQRAEGRARVGAPAPGWELASLDGKPVKLADFRGRVLVVTWFASWCPPCNDEAPVLENEVWRKFRDQGLTVIGVNTAERRDPPRMAREFVAKHGLTYPVVLDVDQSVSKAYQVEALPTTALIDRKGVLRRLLKGFDRDGLLREVQALLAEPAAVARR